MTGRVAVLGVFNADTTYRTARVPEAGETLMGTGFVLGPGGKGSNQAVAAARAGAEVAMISRLGRDAFGEMARRVWAEAGVTPAVREDDEMPTGAACILVEEATGQNRIIVARGAASRMDAGDAEAQAEAIRAAQVFLVQLEQPLEAARRGLEIAREAGVFTILNPAPAVAGAAELLDLADLVTPNESETEALTGVAVTDEASAREGAAALMAAGARAALVTMGRAGAFYSDGAREAMIPAMPAGKVVDTTGAGDAFNGGLAAALARGVDAVEAARFGAAVAGISVTRPGAAASMPTRDEAEAHLAAQSA